jgi:hypothetical protein
MSDDNKSYNILAENASFVGTTMTEIMLRPFRNELLFEKPRSRRHSKLLNLKLLRAKRKKNYFEVYSWTEKEETVFEVFL